MTDTTTSELIAAYDRGVIVICPNCMKIDIDPRKHFMKCNPEEEAHRLESHEYYD